jgi:hypothetical protein
MLKKIVLVAAIVSLFPIGLAPSPASAADSRCSDAAKARFPDDHAARKEFKHWCKDQWKIYKKLHK